MGDFEVRFVFDDPPAPPKSKPKQLTIAKVITRLQIPGHALMYATTERLLVDRPSDKASYGQ